VGAVDALVDIVGASAGISLLGVDEVRFGRLPLGRGFVNAAHGRIPLPAPATLEILTGIPVDMVETEGETVTPTGAALLAGLGTCAPLPPGSVVGRIGYGIGAREFPDRPNLVRLVLAESGSQVSAGEVSVLTTIVDDMGGENLGFLMERLFEAGALDVYFIPATMKKSRPAVEITALAPPALEEVLAAELLRHSTSLGLRLRRETRRELPREILTIATPWGPVGVKRAGTAPAWRYSPEYEDCARIAREHGLRIQEVLDAALRAASGL
jgi:uncharacterized protein (TIGR00299 family) protein